MTDQQLYLAIGIPAALFCVNLLAVLWQARGLERLINARMEGVDIKIGGLATKIDRLEGVMEARFTAVEARFMAVDAKFDAAREGQLRVEQVLDARLKHLEERER